MSKREQNLINSTEVTPLLVGPIQKFKGFIKKIKLKELQLQLMYRLLFVALVFCTAVLLFYSIYNVNIKLNEVEFQNYLNKNLSS